jgi:hypothetical protein
MEEEEKEINQSEESVEQARTRVGFPQAPEKKSGFDFKIFYILLIILLAIGAGAWYLFGRSKQEIVSNNLSPTSGEGTVQEESPTPAEETVDRGSIRIEILNGTGMAGVAGNLEEDLKKLGYSDFKTGNADNFSHEATEVAFSSSVPEVVQKEIKGELVSLYETVNEGSSVPEDYDVSITVGFTKGYSPTPTSKPKTTATPAEEPTETPTP